MGTTATAKTIPVSVGTEVEDLKQFRDLSDEKGACEKKLATLKPRVLAIIPAGNDKHEVEAERNGENGHYTVTRVDRATTTVDYEKLIEIMAGKGLAKAPLQVLVDTNAITQADIKKCTKVTVSTFPLVAFKSDDTQA